ncbi:MAG: MoaD/ThiS family protein [Nanoarchaeota archaeon]|nr:MoaD/ThiS family protein [Nanoarchaeota archaeon]
MEFERQFKGKVMNLLKELGINPETVVVTKDNELITEEDILDDSDEIRILSVVSGG